MSHSAKNESFPIFVHFRTHSACAQNRKTFGSQSESSITSPESSASQNRALSYPSRALRHPGALG